MKIFGKRIITFFRNPVKIGWFIVFKVKSTKTNSTTYFKIYIYIYIYKRGWDHRHLFHSKIYVPSSSLLQGKHLPFSPSPIRLNMFRLFVIDSLTQLYRYSPEIFLFSTVTFKYTPSDELDKNIHRTYHFLFFSHWNGYSHFRFVLDFSYAFGIL